MSDHKAHLRESMERSLNWRMSSTSIAPSRRRRVPFLVRVLNALDAMRSALRLAR